MAETERGKIYHFDTEWEKDFFFYSHSKPVYLMSNAMVALAKKGNLERSSKTVNGSYERDFPAKTQLRTTKVRDLNARLAARESIFTKLNTLGKAATIASARSLLNIRRCEGMALDVEEQLGKNTDACECFSVQFDESTDMADVA